MTTQENDLSADFASGFDDVTAAPVEHVEQPQPEVIEQPAESPEAAEQSAVAEQPSTVSLTKEEWETARAQLNELAEFRRQAAKQIDGIAGKYGEVNRTLQSLPKAVSPAFNPEIVARLKVDYPELGELFEQAGAAAQAAPAQAPAINQEEIDRRINETVAQREERLRMELRHEMLSDTHEDWKEIVVSPEFEQWRLQQPAEFAEKLIKSHSVKVVADGVSKFKEFLKSSQQPATPPAPPAPPKRKARLEAAITPQGSPSRGAPTKTEADYFKEGFNS
jgi:hypothetical protein